MQRIKADVLVLGTGAAGMMAAMEAQERGAEVLTVGKGATGKGTCTSLAGGAFTVSSEQFPPEEHYQATMEAGRGLNDARFVEMVVNRARECMDKLIRMGAPLFNFPRGCLVDNRGNTKDIPGMALVQSMKNIVNKRGIKTVSSFHCFDLLISEGTVAGVLGLTGDGEPTIISAPAVVFATGGAAAIYQRHDNPVGITGDGYAMALRAGLPLQDMEFVQFYPVGLAQPELPAFIIYPPYPPEAEVLDAEGNDVFKKLENCKDLNQAIIRYRDTSSLLFYQEHMKGGLFLDLSAVPEATWNALYSLRLLARLPFDFRKNRVRIAPLAHFFMGGVVVNTKAETSLPGLFAAGEVTGGFHGANRLGGNALTECIVCGSIAGARAAEYASYAGSPENSGSRATDLIPPWATLRGNAVRPEYHQLFNRIKRTAWECAGIVRSGEGIEQGLVSIQQIEADLEALLPSCVKEGLKHKEVQSSILVLKCILEASSRRKESRGALYREDYPKTDNNTWKQNLRISLDSLTKNLLILDDIPAISSDEPL